MALTLIYILPTSNIQINIPLDGTYTIDWGDVINSSNTFTYDTPGTKIIKITGNISSLIYNPTYLNTSNSKYLISCTDFGNVGLTSISFNGAINLTNVPSTLPSSVNDISLIFANTEQFNQDLSSWDLSNITSMIAMFYNAKKFNNLVNWTMPKQSCSMLNCFLDAILFNQDISDWDVSKITNLQEAFKNTKLSITNYNKLLYKWGDLPNLQETIFIGNLLIYTTDGIVGRQKLINKGWDIQDDILLVPSTIYVGKPFLTKYNHDIWNPLLYGGKIIIKYGNTTLEELNINIDTRDLILNPITINDVGNIQLTINIQLSDSSEIFRTEYINLYINPSRIMNKPKMSMSSLFTNNAMVYYKPHSLAPGGIGGVRNYRKKSKKT
jgi:hypothetical protein